MRVWAVANQKGGTGKTTTAVNVAAGLALKGRRVLLVDLDPQASASAWLGHQRADRALLDVLVKGAPLAPLALETGTAHLSLIPGSPLLRLAGDALASKPGRDVRLRKALAALPAAWDWVLLDCAPYLDVLALMALAAADRVLVPVETRTMALSGLEAVRELVADVRDTLNPALEVGAILPCRVDSRTLLSQQVIAHLRETHGKLVLKTVVRENVRLAEAPGHNQTIFTYAPESAGAEDYAAVAAELLQREGKR